MKSMEKTLAKRDAKIARIRQELAAGERVSALLRAKGLASTFPLSAEVRDVAGQAHFEAGEYLTAGLHWSLSGRDDEAARSCIDRFVSFYGSDEQLYEAYKFRQPPFGLSDSAAVNERLEALKQRMLDAGHRFADPEPPARSQQASMTLAEVTVGIAIFGGLLLIPLVLLAGVFQIASWMLDWP